MLMNGKTVSSTVGRKQSVTEKEGLGLIGLENQEVNSIKRRCLIWGIKPRRGRQRRRK
jgi:hypothetical protein